MLWSQAKRLKDVGRNDSQSVFTLMTVVCEKGTGVIRGNLWIYLRASLALHFASTRGTMYRANRGTEMNPQPQGTRSTKSTSTCSEKTIASVILDVVLIGIERLAQIQQIDHSEDAI